MQPAQLITLKYQWPRLITPQTKTGCLVDMNSNVICLPAACTPGVDIICWRHHLAGDVFPIAVQTKLSGTTASAGGGAKARAAGSAESDNKRLQDKNDVRVIEAAVKHVHNNFQDGQKLIVSAEVFGKFNSTDFKSWLERVFHDDTKMVEPFYSQLVQQKLLPPSALSISSADLRLKLTSSQSKAIDWFIQCRTNLVIKSTLMKTPIFVYIALRRPPPTLRPEGARGGKPAKYPITTASIPERVLMLYVDELEQLYGPTLWSRPQFLADQQESSGSSDDE